MACRSGCPTQDHASWGECAKSARFAVQWLGGTGPSYGGEKAWNRENAAYAQARKDGLAPSTVTREAVNAAYDAAS